VCYSLYWRLWRVRSVYGGVGGAGVIRCMLLCMLEVPEVMRCVLFRVLEAVKGMSDVLEVIRCVLLCIVGAEGVEVVPKVVEGSAKGGRGCGGGGAEGGWRLC